MAQTTGKGVPSKSIVTGLPKGSVPHAGNRGLPGRTVSAVTGVPLGQGKVAGGANQPSATAAFYAGGKGNSPKVSSVSAIPASKPRAGSRPNVHPVQRRK